MMSVIHLLAPRSADRCKRKLKLAHDYASLQPFLCDVNLLLAKTLAAGGNILIEGHQAFGLSNYHGDYPFTSSRDTTAAALLSELGLGPRWPLRIILVIKSYATRNHQGSLPHELNAAEAQQHGIVEYDGGSWGKEDQLRRAGKLDFDILRRAVIANTPTEIALTAADYIDPAVRGACKESDLTQLVMATVSLLEKNLGLPVTLISTGPDTAHMVSRKGAQITTAKDSIQRILDDK